MYAFAQRKDTTVMDEPFYGIYLNQTGYDHPGRSEILAEMPLDQEIVVQKIREAHLHSHVFIKNMAAHFRALDRTSILEFTNVILIRDPKRIVVSFDKVIQQPTQQDIGIKWQYDLYHWLKSKGQTPIVVDSNAIAQQPRQQLKALCEALSLPFDEAMLHWEPGSKPYDGIWAPYWYRQVHQSSGFLASQTSEVEVPEHLRALYLEAFDYYRFLRSRCIENHEHVTII